MTSVPILPGVTVVRQRIVVIAPPGSSAESVDELLRRYPYIRFNRAAWVAPMIERRLGEYDARPNTRAEIQSVEAIHHLVQQGFGISILPDVSNGSADAAGASVRILDFGAPPLYRTVGLISQPGFGEAQCPPPDRRCLSSKPPAAEIWHCSEKSKSRHFRGPRSFSSESIPLSSKLEHIFLIWDHLTGIILSPG